jgi:minor extracellular serine protease Vpr
MRKLLVGISALLVGMTMMSHAQAPQSVSLDSGSTDLWFVELSSEPTIDGTSLATLEREEANFHAAATGAGARYAEKQHFRDLWNGMTVRASAGDAAKLRGLPNVLGVYPVQKVTLSQQAEEQPGIVPDLITALAMTGADVAQSELGLSGRGVHVAVIDSGIDFDHPDLGGCFGPGCRVDKGFDLVGDDYDSSSDDPARQTPVPDPIPDDCGGHGTHVAGIIGANGGIKGVAPGVKFGAYRVFGCDGTTSDDVILEAMERAFRDRMDVVNMSLGSRLAWPQSPSAKAADRLVRRGVVVVAAAGNDGTIGLYASSAPALGKNVISVASFDNTHANLAAFSISPDDTRIGYIEAAGAPPPPTSGSFPMARTGTTTSTADACNALPAGSLTGRVALIRRGTCSFYQKAFNAQSAGASGVVLYNNVAGFLSPIVVPVPPATAPITIPVVAVTAARGALIDGRLASGAVTMKWTNQVGSEPNPTANLISSFSSYGPSPDLSFKPDIGAPGGLVRSTLPLEQGGYGVLSGTSMATPHVAGTVALLLEANPHLDPQEVQDRLQNSGSPHLSAIPTLPFLDNVHRQGAGMVQIAAAVQADAVISPATLALGEIESGNATRVLNISLLDSHRRHDDDEDLGNRGWHRRHRHDDDPPVTYTLGHQAAVATGQNTFTPSFFASFATVTFNPPTVTLGGRHHGRNDDDAAIKVTITPPPPTDGSRLFGGYITFTPSDGGPVLRVPYTGYKGDYQAIPVFTLAGLPALAKLTATGFVPQPGGATFTMAGDDIAFILLHLDHPVANLRMEVFDVVTGRSLNFADDEDFLPRNSQATSSFVFAWDGTTMRRSGGRLKTVPNGTYRIELSVLKALGDPRNPAHFERWNSPNITIARP